MYLCWRSLVNLTENFILNFLVAGHTKNVVDGASGHIRRKLKYNDARTPAEMMVIMEISRNRTQFVQAQHVPWRLWKEFLQAFKMLTSYAITKYHFFRFKRESPGQIFAKEFSFSVEEMSLNMLHRGVSLESIRHQEEEVWTDPQYVTNIIPRCEVVGTA